jgi:hypothetical protein
MSRIRDAVLIVSGLLWIVIACWMLKGCVGL